MAYPADSPGTGHLLAGFLFRSSGFRFHGFSFPVVATQLADAPSPGKP